MGYLSCRADSSILTCNTHSSAVQTLPTSKSEKPKRKKKTLEGEETWKTPTIQHFNYSDLEAATDGFSAQKLLGRGSHGCVYKGVLRGGRLVAVKKPSRPTAHAQNPTTQFSSAAAADTNEVENEIAILSKIRSPRLVNLVGFTPTPTRDSGPSSRLLVVEFMSNGTLFDVLHSSQRPPGWGRRLRLALQTALAIDTLHSSIPPVIHRDIKSANILIDRNFNARLGDFGLALRCHADDFRLRSTPPAGTLGYLDPCYVTPDNLSTKTDVFSFGILLLEIISGRKAMDVGHSPPSIVDWAIPLVRKGKLLALYDPRIAPPKDHLARKQLALLAAKCVRSGRERRPSMKEVVECLKVLSKTVPGNLWDNIAVNPCRMVDEVGHAIGTRIPNPNSNLGARQQEVGAVEEVPWSLRKLNSTKSVHPVRNTSRVFSDVGSSSRNLMDLMAGTDGDSGFKGSVDMVESASLGIRGLGLRVGSERSFGRMRTQLLEHDYDGNGIFQLRRNQSANLSKEARNM
ncbi:serine/threonine-protein kinase-like protein At3g51990 [Magnolia sinica]|uniref:serine/threonine-protein kinase-like protein At3g51990 n=1 Tax=Magnolia sinica TaxID=86752 RepID=UPI002659CCE3|nr:serine/threonine-protein kinase-like protein At3g51990 [Magnolia sinica]